MLNREDGYVLRRSLKFEVKDQRRKESLKRTWKKQVEDKRMLAGLSR